MRSRTERTPLRGVICADLGRNCTGVFPRSSFPQGVIPRAEGSSPVTPKCDRDRAFVRWTKRAACPYPPCLENHDASAADAQRGSRRPPARSVGGPAGLVGG